MIHTKDPEIYFSKIKLFEHSYEQIMQNDSIYITASIGVSTFPRHDKDIHSLVRRAKIALSYSKKTGKNRYHIFNELEDEELDGREKERYNIVKNLKNAIPDNEFNILYQPIVSIPGNRIVGAEALLRWNSKILGAVPPGNFIPIAEETNEIIPIGEWVLDNAIEQYSKWLEMGYSQMRMAVNLSTCQLYDSSLINRLMGLKEIYPIDLGNIELKITESAMIRNFETVVRILDGLHKLGIKISIDDFGSGYSSLNYITSLVIDHVKVDKSYIDDITNSCKKRLTVKAVIDLAHKMGIGVTAEGVEDTGQLQLLRKLRCDRYQGFVFSKPLEAQDFERLLEQQLQDG